MINIYNPYLCISNQAYLFNTILMSTLYNSKIVGYNNVYCCNWKYDKVLISTNQAVLKT